MVIMSVDYGDRRTGLAVSDQNETFAFPVTVINESDKETLIDEITNIAVEKNARIIVVGLPKNMDGTEGERASACRNFALELTKKSGIETVMYDERLTTVSANKALNTTDTRGKKRKNVIDEVAAVMILEDYLRFKSR